MHKQRTLLPNKPTQATEEGIYWIYHYQKPVDEGYLKQIWGKWLLFVSEEYVDEDWDKLVRAFDEGKLSARKMKVSTKWSRSHVPSYIQGTQPKGEIKYVICIYTSRDEEEIMRVREQLRQLGFTHKIPYKTNEATLQGKYGRGAAQFWE